MEFRCAAWRLAAIAGITRVEVSFDDGKTWQDAKLDYPGTKLTWAL